MIDLPEINFAKRLLERRKLKPPIDVFGLAKQYARVKKTRFPVDVDGICLNLKRPGKRPTIIINEAMTDTRIRFTLAHELGHVVIPWHTGIIVDEIDVFGHDFSHGYWALEAEANRFASELLMPTDWVLKRIQDLPEPLDLTSHVAGRAEVSFQAATIKVINCLPSGYVFAQIEDDIVLSSGRSFGTFASPPQIGRRIDPDALFPWTRPERRQIGGTTFYWWQFDGNIALPADIDEDWRELLEEILSNIKVPAEMIVKFKFRLNGIIAGANGQIKKNRTAETVFEACLQRLHSRIADIPLLATIIAHPKFEAFLAAKVSSMMTE